MLSAMLSIFQAIFVCLKIILIPIAICLAIFSFLCLIWVVIYRFKGKHLPKNHYGKIRKHNILYKLFYALPKQYVDDIYNTPPDTFKPRGVHMFCGEQGSGKTIATVEMMLRYHKIYTKSKCISNFGVTFEDKPLNDWHQLLDYTNGKQGVIVGIDEIQNWFMSGRNQLPPQMLEVVTQNRKNHRVICCTAQVFTRVNKGIREQVNMVYNPRTFFGCLTIVIKRKPIFDSEGNVEKLKYKGMYMFVHNEELREAYDTYKVIHNLCKDGFKETLTIDSSSIKLM